MPLSVTDLYMLYDLYSREYFQNSLPSSTDVTIEYSSRLNASAGVCYPQKRLIRLSTHYHSKYPKEVPITLLHEMIHLLVPNHGSQFKVWIERIKQMGGNVELRSKERATQAAYRWKYTCKSCNRIYLKKRRLASNSFLYRCGICSGNLEELRLV